MKWSISSLYLEKIKSHRKLSRKWNGKNCEISDPHNFWTHVKSNIPNVRNWNCWDLLGSEIEVRGPWPTAYPSPPLSLMVTPLPLSNYHRILSELRCKEQQNFREYLWISPETFDVSSMTCILMIRFKRKCYEFLEGGVLSFRYM